jgi:hypothetical protein
MVFHSKSSGGVWDSQEFPFWGKEWYQAFLRVSIDLIIGFLDLIIKTFEYQTETWDWLSIPLIINLFEMIDDNHDYFVYKTFTHKSNKTDSSDKVSTWYITVNRPTSSLWSSPRMTNPHFGTVHTACRTPTWHGSVCLVCRMHWQNCPVTIWKIPRVHTLDITVFFGVLTRSSVVVFSSSRWMFGRSSSVVNWPSPSRRTLHRTHLFDSFPFVIL